MRELVPVVKCDRCNDPISIETRSSIASIMLAGEPEKRYAGENCETCRDEFKEEIERLLGEFLIIEAPKRTRVRRTPEEVEATDGDGWSVEDRTCKRPECVARGYVAKTRSALGQHLKQKHGSSFAKEGMAKLPALNKK